MGHIRDEIETDRAGLIALLRPRDDALVAEALPDGAPADGTPAGDAVFDASDGPFESYRRTVAWRTGDGGTVHVVQEVRWRLAFPYWRWLYSPVVRRSLAHGIPPGTRPWWSFPDRLDARQSRVVATMALFNLVAGLLFSALTQVLTFADADIGTGSRSQQATILAVVRIGAVVTFVAMALADRVGRRRIALWSFGTATALTVASAAVPDLAWLAALQLLSRNLAVAGILAVDTISVEELPAGSRAQATGLGALAYGLGAGVPVLALPLADVGPAGWRLVFLTALVCVPLLVSGARNLPESNRYLRMAEGTAPPERRRIRGLRFLLLASVFLLLNLFVAPASQLQNDYLRTERGYSGAMITLILVLTSTPGAIGVMLGGRLADRRGRRITLIPGLVSVGVFNAIFFLVAGAGMWLASLGGSVLGALCVAPLGVLAPELFPTARRGGARGALNLIAVVGSVVGLLSAGALVDALGYGPAFALLAAGPLLAACLAFAAPETRGRELEDINRD